MWRWFVAVVARHYAKHYCTSHDVDVDMKDEKMVSVGETRRFHYSCLQGCCGSETRRQLGNTREHAKVRDVGSSIINKHAR